MSVTESNTAPPPWMPEVRVGSTSSAIVIRTIPHGQRIPQTYLEAAGGTYHPAGASHALPRRHQLNVTCNNYASHAQTVMVTKDRAIIVTVGSRQQLPYICIRWQLVTGQCVIYRCRDWRGCQPHVVCAAGNVRAAAPFALNGTNPDALQRFMPHPPATHGHARARR